MKKAIKMAAIAFCGVAMLSLTACLSGGNSGEEAKFKQITQTEKSVIMGAVVGNYSGKMRFRKGLGTNETDSVNIAWTVTADTMLVIDKFPVRALANIAKTGTDKQKEIGTADAVEVRMKLQLPTYMLENYYNQGYYILGPVAGKEIDITAAGKAGKLYFTNTLQGGTYSSPRIHSQLEHLNKRQVVRLCVERIVMDNSPYDVQDVVLLLGEKR